MEHIGSKGFAELKAAGMNGMFLTDQALHQTALLVSALLITFCELGILVRECGEPERDRAGPLEAACLFALAAQEGEGEVEAVDFPSPVFGDGAFAAGEEVFLQFVQAGQHLRVDAQHGGSGCRACSCWQGSSVGASAGAEFDATLVEVLVELRPFRLGRLAVLALGPLGPSAVEELLVVADDVVVEDGDVAAGGLDIQVTEQGGADVDGEAAVDDVRCEQAACVRRGRVRMTLCSD
ncbi:hypothetical protein QMK19_33200 [Streptomyces sp. H10-C2]|uniref:hypothetical protein n=1 Tax=unclassified Streptomyces TaxID=2593676 RepID=UPI0024B9D76F|nr:MULTISPECIES: hypothetical protein [unclassified Streptomyces]MDJ0346558.1 hypothetical protein [Streptomyces sp. PH10-H1]MDJ0374363.1 hypothetical protein [Streptomyces sp. H10-C2]